MSFDKKKGYASGKNNTVQVKIRSISPAESSAKTDIQQSDEPKTNQVSKPSQPHKQDQTSKPSSTPKQERPVSAEEMKKILHEFTTDIKESLGDKIDDHEARLRELEGQVAGLTAAPTTAAEADVGSEPVTDVGSDSGSKPAVEDAAGATSDAGPKPAVSADAGVVSEPQTGTNSGSDQKFDTKRIVRSQNRIFPPGTNGKRRVFYARNEDGQFMYEYPYSSCLAACVYDPHYKVVLVWVEDGFVERSLTAKEAATYEW